METRMSDAVELRERPQSEQMYMLVGWEQWADGGSVSSGLPRFLVQETGARKIGHIRPDGFYLFQIPGTHDLVRPVVKFEDGFPESLEARRNNFYFTGDDKQGIVLFTGDEPHMDVERYVEALLSAARELGVQRIVSMAGVYGELPYDKERLVSAIYSKPALKPELEKLAVNFSDYHGGASIGSYLCRRAADAGIECVGFYAFIPTYDFSSILQMGQGIRIENDFGAWYGVLKRINFMLKTRFDLTEIQEKYAELTRTIAARLAELDRESPEAGIQEYVARLSEDFEEVIFDPLEDVWAQEISRLFGDDEDDSEAR
jgi:proteasome assembly chaperone (PAC2) family protein